MDTAALTPRGLTASLSGHFLTKTLMFLVRQLATITAIGGLRVQMQTWDLGHLYWTSMDENGWTERGQPVTLASFCPTCLGNC